MKKYINLNNNHIQEEFRAENRNRGGIYRWTNLINGKAYIGSAVDFPARFSKYLNINALKKNKMLISLAILKYGLENFSLEILEYCSKENLLEREQYYLDTYSPEYNILKIAGSSQGYIHNENSLMKISSRQISEETLNKMRSRIQSPETKIKISKAIGLLVEIINTETKEIILFHSKKEAAKYLNTSDSSVGRYIKSGKIFANKYLITEKN